VAIRWSTPTSAKTFQKVRSIKCDPPSLMTIKGTSNMGKMTSWNILFECVASATQQGRASTHLEI
jgi:hypothetical protein